MVLLFPCFCSSILSSPQRSISSGGLKLFCHRLCITSHGHINQFGQRPFALGWHQSTIHTDASLQQGKHQPPIEPTLHRGRQQGAGNHIVALYAGLVRAGSLLAVTIRPPPQLSCSVSLARTRRRWSCYARRTGHAQRSHIPGITAHYAAHISGDTNRRENTNIEHVGPDCFPSLTLHRGHRAFSPEPWHPPIKVHSLATHVPDAPFFA